jgi:hypothetical protein
VLAQHSRSYHGDASATPDDGFRSRLWIYEHPDEQDIA